MKKNRRKEERKEKKEEGTEKKRKERNEDRKKETWSLSPNFEKKTYKNCRNKHKKLEV